MLKKTMEWWLGDMRTLGHEASQTINRIVYLCYNKSFEIKYEDTRIPVCPILCRMKISGHRRQIWVFPYICGEIHDNIIIVASPGQTVTCPWGWRPWWGRTPPAPGGCTGGRLATQWSQLSSGNTIQIILPSVHLLPELTWKANMVKAHTVTRVTPPAIAMMSSLKMSASLENIVNCRLSLVQC